MNEFELFCLFFYIGLITIGGGLVAIPIMQQLLVEKGLISAEKFVNMLAISESTPGPIGINMATYIGYEMFGVFGGVITTIGTVLPSLICIMIIARFFAQAVKHRIVKNAFYGLRPAVSGMIAVAAWNVIALTVVSVQHIVQFDFLHGFFVPQAVFFICALILLFKTKLHPALIVAFGAVFGIVFL